MPSKTPILVVRGLPLGLLLLTILCLIAAWILIVVGLTRAEWVTGTEASPLAVPKYSSGINMKVGLFKQCTGSNCFYIGHDGFEIDVWKAAAAFFILGLICLGITFILALLCVLFYLQLLNYTKIFLSISNFFMTIAIILIPIGFAWLDDACPTTPANDAQCGLICASGPMNFFSLCDPFTVGGGLWAVIAGIFIQFIGSLFLSCLNKRVVVQTN
eukprot:m.268316 g.268316  ORF g.268316 m.268316 type:complete len:215 (+) comp34689_c0_seq1:72-716(+)